MKKRANKAQAPYRKRGGLVWGGKGEGRGRLGLGKVVGPRGHVGLS